MPPAPHAAQNRVHMVSGDGKGGPPVAVVSVDKGEALAATVVS
jgi:hypothetical protein